MGLVAADAEVEFRLAGVVSATVRATLGANEVAVQGGGLRLDVGVGTRAAVSVGFHGITSFGLAAYAWMRFEPLLDTPLGAGVEVTIPLKVTKLVARTESVTRGGGPTRTLKGIVEVTNAPGGGYLTLAF